MMRGYSTLAEYRWPGGLPRAIAILGYDPETLAGRLGVRFSEDVDDLDRIKQVYLQLPSGRVVVLRKHAGDPTPGTTVYSDVNDSVGDAVEEVTSALRLQPHELTWVAAADP